MPKEKTTKLISCKYCNLSFDEAMNNSKKANHIRWCVDNPNRIKYLDNMSLIRSKITQDSRKKMRDSLKKAHEKGKYKDSHKKGVETKRKKGTLQHTEEAKQKIKQKALSSSHRRLRRGVVKYKDILLDSSWELALAKRLDDLGIYWIRPLPLKWVDSNGEFHNYFPDFYLPECDIYIDPKNPHAIKVQQDKIDILKKQYKLVILDSLEKCKNF